MPRIRRKDRQIPRDRGKKKAIPPPFWGEAVKVPAEVPAEKPSKIPLDIPVEIPKGLFIKNSLIGE
jgi:hypothetical protein